MRALFAVAVAVAVGLLVAGRPGGPWLMRRIGGSVEPSLTFEVDYAWGPVPVEQVLPIWKRRLAPMGVRVRADGDQARVDVLGARERDADWIAIALTRPGKLELVEVLEDSETMRAAYRDATTGRWPGVDAEVDGWRHDDTGRQYSDYYLTSSSLQFLTAAIGEIQVEPGTRIAIETIQPHSQYERPLTMYRTYLVVAEPFLGSEDIANAQVIWDPYVNRPEVLVEFDEAGTRKFGEATRRLIGRKLAMLLDDKVVSAPVVQSAITGGRSNISMGGGDPVAMEAEAEALVAALKTGADPLPAGLRAQLVSAHVPSVASQWAVRFVAALLVGAATWFLAGWVVRRRWLEPAPRGGRGRLGDGLVVTLSVTITVSVPILLWLAERIRLPGVAEEEAYGAVTSIVALGPWPAFVAFFLVELVALAVPRLRRGRRGAAIHRRRLDLAVLFVAAVLALALAWDRVTALRDLESIGIGDLLPKKLDRVAAIASLVSGVMLYAVAARVVSRWGVCNGWIVILGSDLLIHLVRSVRHTTQVEGARPTLVGLAVLGGALAVALTALRAGRRRAPAAGLAPVLFVPLALAARPLFYAFDFADLGKHTYQDLVKLLDDLSLITSLVVTAVLAAGLAVWGGGRRVAPLTVAIAFAGLFVLLDQLVPVQLANGHPVVERLASTTFGYRHPALVGAIIGVALAEVVRGTLRRIRMGDGVPVAVIHDLDRADDYAAALAAAGIPAAVEGAAPRALLRGLGSFSPVVVRVPAARLDDALLVPSPATDPLLSRTATVFE